MSVAANSTTAAIHGQRLALAALIAGGIVIGFSPIMARLGDVGPIAMAFLRVFLAGITLAPLLLLLAPAASAAPTQQSRWPTSLREASALLLPGLLFAGDLATWHWALEYTTVGNSTLIANQAAPLVALTSWLILGRRFGPMFWLGLVLCSVGAMILLGSSVKLGGDRWFGDLLAFGTAICYAGYFLLIERLRRRYDAMVVVSWSSLSAALWLLPVFWLASEPALFPATLAGWGAALGLAWLCHLGGQGLIAYGLAALPAAFAALAVLLQPITALLLAWWLFGEALGPVQALGSLTILTGLVLARRGV